MLRESRKKKNPKSYLTPNEVAQLLMVSPTTVRHWASRGKLKSSVTPGGHRRFLRSDIDSFCRENDVTLALPDDEVIRVLIVDDDEEITRMLGKLFEYSEPGVVTKSTSSGFEAGRLVASFAPHVVLLDLMMPGVDGFEVCRTIKEDPTSKATRVIAMTGFYVENNVERILGLGAEACLSKPFTFDTLSQIIGIEKRVRRQA